MKDYQKSITVNNTVSEVYTAITENIASWWSNDLTGAAAHSGDSFTIAFGNTGKTIDIVEAIPDQQIIWKCVKAYIDMASLQNKAEWVGTRLIWTFKAAEQGTTLHFLHEGLNQHFECYSICESGWDNFLASLEAYLSTGKGRPYLKPSVDHTTTEKKQPVS